jgi:hypothetical protein
VSEVRDLRRAVLLHAVILLLISSGLCKEGKKSRQREEKESRKALLRDIHDSVGSTRTRRGGAKSESMELAARRKGYHLDMEGYNAR